MQHILIIDDDYRIASLLGEVFSLHGYRVTADSCAISALKAARIDPPDGVITDYRMPNMNGLELLRELRKSSPDLPSIIVSGFVSDIADVEPGIEVVSKPAKAVDLVLLMVELLEVAEREKPA